MPTTRASGVDAYIAKQPPDAQAVLQRVRRIIRKRLPQAEEGISYQIPTYKLNGQYVVYFAGWKRHWSLYPVTESVRAALEKELEPYELSKGTVRFPLAEPVPTRLVERIVGKLARLAEARGSAIARRRVAAARSPRRRSGLSSPRSGRPRRASIPRSR
jgi:uncharacterized protein YdhG (YjbR/CyaY superfamily)